jgi:hypothetical protein
MKVLSLGNAQGYKRGETMAMPKVERKRQIMAQRFNYGVDIVPTQKYIALPDMTPTNLVRRKRIGSYKGMDNIHALRDKVVEPVKIERVKQKTVDYNPQSLGLHGMTKEQWVQARGVM